MQLFLLWMEPDTASRGEEEVGWLVTNNERDGWGVWLDVSTGLVKFIRQLEH